MLTQGQVGALATTSSISPGTQPPLRLGNMQDLVISEGRGRYYEPSYRKQLFNGANQTGVVTTVGLATTYTGLCLSNPINSTVNLAVNKVGYTFLVAFAAAAAIGLMTGFNSGTNVAAGVAGVTHSSFFNGAATAQGLIWTGATLPTAPFVTHIFGAGLTGAITTAPDMAPALIDLEGSLILPPGAYTAIYTSTVSGAASLLASFQWEEVPL